jgi:hypothetical protein
MRSLVVILGLLASVALAQAPAAATELDATLLFDLLGSANAIAVDVPEEVEAILVAGSYGGETYLWQEASTSGEWSGRRIEVMAGGVSAVGRCDSIAFVRIAFITEPGRPGGGRFESRCFDGEERLAFAKLHTGGPLIFVGATTELPLDSWLAFEAMRVGSGVIERPADAFVFYIYLNSSHDQTDVAAPDYDSWSAVARAFEPGR